MKKLYLFVLLLIFSLNSYPDSRGVKLRAREFGVNENEIGKQWLLLIAINEYTQWPNLKNPIKDAREIRKILTENYYFDEILEIYDNEATKAGIIKSISKIKTQIKLNDSLLIYYAGHGHFDELSKTGFWIPQNAGIDEFEQENWLPNIQIRGYLNQIKAKHVALISDSCFSGDILNLSRGKRPEINNEFLKKAYSRRSKEVLTSGASETVPDDSEFSMHLKNILEYNTKSFLDLMTVYNEIKLGIFETLPLFGNLKGSGSQEGGTFILFKRDEKLTESGNNEFNNQRNSHRNTYDYLGNFVLVKGNASIKHDFYISKYEVTQEEFIKLMNFNPSEFRSETSPVENVSWFDAIIYCNKLSREQNLAVAYNDITGKLVDKFGNPTSDLTKVEGYRLPTQAEWEYSAKGAKNSSRYKYSGGNYADELAWYWKNSGIKKLSGTWDWEMLEKNNGRTHSVGLKKANEIGLYDMSGNVWEWCHDWYNNNKSSGEKILVGGSWSSDLEDISVFNIGSYYPNEISNDTGFRIVRTKIQI